MGATASKTTKPAIAANERRIHRTYFDRFAYLAAGALAFVSTLNQRNDNANGNFPDVRGRFPEGQRFEAKTLYLDISFPTSNNAGGAVAGAWDDLMRVIRDGVLVIRRGGGNEEFIRVPLSRLTSAPGGAEFFSSGGSVNNTQVANIRSGHGYPVPGLVFQKGADTTVSVEFPAAVAVAAAGVIEVAFDGDWIGPK